MRAPPRPRSGASPVGCHSRLIDTKGLWEGLNGHWKFRVRRGWAFCSLS